MATRKQKFFFRLFLVCAVLLLGTALVGVSAQAPPNGTAPPNILLLMMDQFRFDALGASGNPAAQTPNLDALASQGVLFRKAYTSTPTCTPARAAILTGQRPWKHGMLGYGVVALSYPFEMPTALSEMGYYTASFGKDHFGWDMTANEGVPHGFQETHIYDGLGDGLPQSNDTNGFDNYDQWFQTQLPGANPLATGLDWNEWIGTPYIFEEELHPTAWVGRSASNFILSYNRTQPFFLKTSFHRPHSPYDPPPRVFNETVGRALPDVIVSGDGWDNVFNCSASNPPGCCTGNDSWCGMYDASATANSRWCYYASVTFVDEWIGVLMAALSERNLLDNTFIVFAADHGDMLSDHWHWRKGYAYESSAHIPMMVRWPEGYPNVSISRGSVNEEAVVELRDIFPTMLAAGGAISMSGVPISEFGEAHAQPIGNLDGKPLTCLLMDPRGSACDWRPYLDLEHSTVYNETVHWNALTDGDMKYIFHAFFPHEQLFNLTEDPGERYDLSQNPGYANVLETWRQRMVEQFEEESRGPAFVVDGKLQQRVDGQTYSPNYPGILPALGSSIIAERCLELPDAWSQLWSLDELLFLCIPDYLHNSTLAGSVPHFSNISDAGPCSTSNSTKLCAATLSFDKNSTLQMANCSSSPNQEFTFDKSSKHIVQPKTGFCLTEFNGIAVMEACTSDLEKYQSWSIGLSGRVFISDGSEICLTGSSVPLPPPTAS